MSERRQRRRSQRWQEHNNRQRLQRWLVRLEYVAYGFLALLLVGLVFLAGPLISTFKG